MALFSWLVALCLLLLLSFWKSQRPKGFPPGPWRLPLIGNVLQLTAKDLLKTLDQLAKKYGPVSSVYAGGKPVIFIHGFPSAKEVLVIKGTEFAGRAEFPITDDITNKKGLLTQSYGEVWKEQRRFSLMLLRSFGVGKKSMEEKILEEATYLIRAFTENMSVPFDPHEFVNLAITNIICTITLGKRFEYDNSFLKILLDELRQTSEITMGPWALLYNAVPFVRGLPLPHQRILATAKKLYAFLGKELEEHKATLVPGEPRDFTDAYLDEMQKAERKGSSFEENQLQVLMADLFLAGTETTSGTLQWGLLYLMAFPEIQEKCQKEIDTVLGNNASLKYEDRFKLPYTNAVIHEIQRISNVVPLGIPHAPIKDVQLFGYKIPKGTAVFVNIHSVLCDESQWKFPNEFNPSNFLNDKGGFVKPEAFLPFSAGPRVCLGENLARMELFLFFTIILSNFQLSWPDKSQAPDFTPQLAVTQCPSPFKMSLKCRQV
ncbi:cytochrome P450 2J6-like [Candoia aspera]|uniref:cytochrome P450 2J6-like n=1 Tax=Candoia aspera TaxID=51853 RepID=UPI002FD7F260